MRLTRSCLSARTIVPLLAALAVTYVAIVLAMCGGPSSPSNPDPSAHSEGATNANVSDGTPAQDTSDEAEGDPTDPLDVSTGRDYLDELGDEESPCVEALVALLGREGIDPTGIEVTVPLPAQTIPDSGERVIWFVVPEIGRVASSQGQEGGSWSAGWVSDEDATELGIEVPSASGPQTAETAYEQLASSATLAELIGGNDPVTALSASWSSWAAANAADIDPSTSLVDVDHVDTVSMTGETRVFILDQASGRRFTATFADPTEGVAFTEIADQGGVAS